MKSREKERKTRRTRFFKHSNSLNKDTSSRRRIYVRRREYTQKEEKTTSKKHLYIKCSLQTCAPEWSCSTTHVNCFVCVPSKKFQQETTTIQRVPRTSPRLYYYVDESSSAYNRMENLCTWALRTSLAVTNETLGHVGEKFKQPATEVLIFEANCRDELGSGMRVLTVIFGWVK